MIKVIHMLLDKGETNFNCIDTSKITDMSLVFGEMLKIHDKDFDVSEWDVSNVTNMEGLFANCVKFNCDLSKWDVRNVENMYAMFDACRWTFEGKGLDKWDVSNVKDMHYMFSRCTNINFNNIVNWDVSNVENMEGMFLCDKTFNADLSKWDVSNVKDMNQMFYECEIFEGKGLENWNVSKVKKKSGVFQGTRGIKNKVSWYKTLK